MDRRSSICRVSRLGRTNSNRTSGVSFLKCFAKSLIITLIISVAVCFLSWLDISGSLFIVAPIMWEIISVIFWIEKYFREVGSLSVQKILVLSLSNPLMLYIGIVVDTMNSFFINIPG